MDHVKYLKELANDHMQEGRRAVSTKLLAAAWEIDRLAALERELAEARKDGARLDYVIDNFEYINFDGWADYADYSAMDLGPEESEQAEVRKAWRKYLDAEMDAK